MDPSIPRVALVLGALLAGVVPAAAQSLGTGGLQTGAPALVAPTVGDPTLADPSALGPVPNIVVPPPGIPATPQLNCVTRQCGLPTLSTPTTIIAPIPASRRAAVSHMVAPHMR